MWAIGRVCEGRGGGKGREEDDEEASRKEHGGCPLTCTYCIKVEGDFYILCGHMRKDGLPTNIFVEYKGCSEIVAILGEGDCSG